MSMKTRKDVPAWFDLDNYRASANYSAKEWANELTIRWFYYSTLMEPHRFNRVDKAQIEDAREFFNGIKIHPLISNKRSDNLLDSFTSEEKECSVVTNLSEFNAYSFLYNSKQKQEIEKEFSVFKFEDGSFQGTFDERKATLDKYRQPIANALGDGESAYLKINLSASDDQLINEFRIWLSAVRGHSSNFIKRQFERKDFDDWFDTRILPYWDLVTISTIENESITFNALGLALFPKNFGTDSTEKVRKVVKKKCEYVFSDAVLVALAAQSE